VVLILCLVITIHVTEIGFGVEVYFDHTLLSKFGLQQCIYFDNNVNKSLMYYYIELLNGSCFLPCLVVVSFRGCGLLFILLHWPMPHQWILPTIGILVLVEKCDSSPHLLYLVPIAHTFGGRDVVSLDT